MTTMVTKGAMNITLSKRSRMPPWLMVIMIFVTNGIGRQFQKGVKKV